MFLNEIKKWFKCFLLAYGENLHENLLTVNLDHNIRFFKNVFLPDYSFFYANIYQTIKHFIIPRKNRFHKILFNKI